MRWREIKKQKTAVPKKKAPITVIYAGFAVRLKAFIIDIFMIYTPILYIIAYVIMGGKDAFQASQTAPLAGVLLYALIYATFLSRSGQTPGKKAYGIKVVDAGTFERIPFFKALLRFVTFLFSATIIYGILTPLFRKDKKALHDLISQTAVIYEAQENGK